MPSANLKQRCMALLQQPDAGELDIDCPETTIRRWQIIRDKDFLCKIYKEWYQLVADAIPTGEKPVLEIGSGAGFMSDFVRDLITSDILRLPQVKLELDACQTLPFAAESLRAVTMVNTFHHLPNVRVFLAEASRCLEPGGALVMIEPWVTVWSRFIYTNLHHEPFLPEASSWQFESTGPLSGANGALPWIVFSRDRSIFQREFPDFQIEIINPFMPLRYLLSGGVSMRCLVPNSTFAFWKSFEDAASAIADVVGMFALVVVRKRER